MSRKKEYGHHCWTDAKTSQHGMMNCAVCGQQITEGPYLCSKKNTVDDWLYVTRHRACSEDRPEWQAFDASAAKQKADTAAYEKDCARFLKRWGAFPDND